MDLWTVKNPVFQIYLIAVALTLLKVTEQGWMFAYRMMRAKSGRASPEDLLAGLYNTKPDPSQLDINNYVDCSRPVFVKQVVRRFHAASLISGALISFSGFNQTGPAGCQFRVFC